MNLHAALIDDLARQAADVLRERRQVPTATYRLQFRGDGFTFRDATAIVPYLRDLGVSHLYCSPCLAARSGSAHGYDVVDHSTFNPSLGSEADFRELVDALHAAGVGQIWDIVPNHMGVAGGENAWWQDVLENGPSSPCSACFDIDWQPAKQELRNKVLLPILGEQYGRVLEEGALQLEFEEGAFRLRYYDSHLPIEPKSYEAPLSLRLEEFKQAQGADAAGVQQLESILTACHHLPDYTRTEPELVEERQREKEMIKRRLADLIEAEPAVGEFIRENVRLLNGDPDDPASFDALDALLNRQVYRVAHWKAAADEINYRRFFDINELAALCVEEPEVFERTHEFIFERLVRGDVDGLRVDHVDGLFDPREYLCRLQRGYVSRIGRALYRQRQAAGEAEGAGGIESSLPWSDESAARPREAQPAASAHGSAAILEGDSDLPEWEEIEATFLAQIAAEHLPELQRVTGWPGAASLRAESIGRPAGNRPEGEPPAAVDWPLYVVVEKILEQNEQLPPEWPVAGTTGYDFLNHAGRLLVDPRGFREMVKSYRRFTKFRRSFADVVYHCKLLILRVAMASELQLLSARLNRLSEKHRRTRDFTLNNLRAALREILACFPVYRTYITGPEVSERDRRFVNEAVLHARRLNPAMDRGLFDFVRRTLLLESPPGLGERDELARLVFVGRFQQASGPVMAKGVEDTAFYRYFPLSSLNEVGGSPAPDELGAEEFHNENRLRQELRPASLIATTTHDTKRTEDTRARISVLSEIPNEWQRAVSRWSRMNRRHLQTHDGERAPSRNDEYLFYQTLVGIWPHQPPGDKQRAELIERLQQYMSKATHEAKQRTSWINPDEEYDAAVREFVAAVLGGGPGRSAESQQRFLADFEELRARIAGCGEYTALSQAFLKLASPGVPDLYQGQELWDFSLVDPDNRRPVDYELRASLLAELRSRCEQGQAAREELARELARQPHDPRLKLLVTWQTLEFRRRYGTLLRNCEYVPLRAEGERAEHVVAFAWRARGLLAAGPDSQSPALYSQSPARCGSDAFIAIVIAPRLLSGLTRAGDDADRRLPFGAETWGETKLCVGSRLTNSGSMPPGFENLFTGQSHRIAERIDVAAVLADFPLALLVDGENAM